MYVHHTLGVWRLFDAWALLFGIMGPYDPKFDLKINIGHYDLYFMAHWFCVISWRLFDVRTSYFGIKSQYISWSSDFALYLEDYLMYVHHTLGVWRLFDAWALLFGIMGRYDPKFDLKINIGHYDLYSWPIDFALYLEDYLMYEHHFLGLRVSIFHGPVISPYILKTIWCMYIILWEYESVRPDFWPKN